MDKTERRQQILSNARDVFAKRGYHAAKIDDIVAAAGVARGTFYLYFEDKRAIFEEIVDGTFARLGQAIMRVDTETPRSVQSQIEENIRRIVHALLEDPATTKILLSDAVGLDPAFDRKLLFFYEEVGKLLEASLVDGQERGIVATRRRARLRHHDARGHEGDHVPGRHARPRVPGGADRRRDLPLPRRGLPAHDAHVAPRRSA